MPPFGYYYYMLIFFQSSNPEPAFVAMGGPDAKLFYKHEAGEGSALRRTYRVLLGYRRSKT